MSQIKEKCKYYQASQWSKTTLLTLPLLVIAAFVLTKSALLDYRFGDGNAYLYDAYLFSKGAVPYRDFFLADFPIQVTLLTIIRPLLRHWIKGYHLVPVLVEATTAYLLFAILRKRGNRFAPLAPLFYLGSFTILATSDFITGVQLTTMFCISGWYLWGCDRPLATGVAFALSFLTKMYTLPACAVFGLVTLLKRRFQPAMRLLAGTLATIIIALAPFAVLAFMPMLEQTFLMHLNRPMGVNKSAVFIFFAVKEWGLLALLVPGLWLCRRDPIALSFAATVVFFLFFPDLYFVYLAFFMPFLVIFSLTFLAWLWQRTSWPKFLAPLLVVVILINLTIANHAYFTDYQKRGHFSNAEEIASAITLLPESLELYGSHEVAPLVALLSGRPIFQNHADTNSQLFAAGALDLDGISRAAVDQGIYLLSRITHYPEQGYRDVGFSGFFSPDRFASSCVRALTFPSTSREGDNQIVAYRCKRDPGQ